MTKSSTLNVTQNLKNPSAQILPADTTTAKQLAIGASAYSAGANDAVLKSLCITSTDSAAQNVQIILNDGTNDRILGTVPVPANSGTNGVAAAVDALASGMLPGLPLDQNGKRQLPLQGGFILKVKSLATVTAAKNIDVTAVIEEY